MENKYSDDVIFINKSEYSAQEYLKVNVLLTKSYTKLYLILALITAVSASIILAISFLGDAFPNDRTIAYIFYVCAFVMVIMYFLPAKLLKKNPSANREMNYEYLFYDDKIVASVSSDSINATETKSYNEFKKVVVRGDYIFIYVTSILAYIVKKDLNSDRLLEFLSTKIKKVKYKK